MRRSRRIGPKPRSRGHRSARPRRPTARTEEDYHDNHSQPADQRDHAPCSPPDERPSHVFALANEVRSLRGELDHTSGGRAAKTLAKTDGIRVTLVLLTRGAILNPESTAGGASLHVLE